jgi:hypothetical protein
VGDGGCRGRGTAGRSAGLVATPVIGTGSQRVLGFALRLAPGSDEVLYRQSALGPVSEPRQAATAPFHEVRVVLYASPTVQPDQVLVATASSVTLHGSVRYETLAVGASRWLVAVAATQPLVGSVAASAQWFALGVGVVGSILIALVIEIEGRRRTTAMILYAGEHDIAETLQRSLLPDLPHLAGLELAARYQAGGDHQQVGGDWFDVFEVQGGGVGIVIGDVIGHDLAAAAAMSQVRAALRAYAWEGAEPAEVLGHLDQLVDAFNIVDLVTVFYGVLGAAGPHGDRLFRYANAGHLYPLLRSPDGHVDLLSDGRSTVIGAPYFAQRSQAQRSLSPGSVLLCYTDGLVETPSRSLEDAMEELRTWLSATASTMAVDSICDQLLATMPRRALHDDIAILGIRIDPRTAVPGPPSETGARRTDE